MAFTVKDMKATVDRTGKAYVTLFNTYGEKLFLGQVQNMSNRKGRLHLVWKLPTTKHVSPYTAYMIHTDRNVLYTDEILPLRADIGIKKFDLELDL